MKVFIAGARSIALLDNAVVEKLRTISQKQYDILIGDCNGVDSAVQRYYTGLGYRRVTVFASNGKARNNIGGWSVKNVAVKDDLKGFDFYKQKDIVMAEDADYGFMIWDGQSRGTLNNIINLLQRNKKVLVYFANENKMRWIADMSELKSIIDNSPSKVKQTFQKLLSTDDDSNVNQQLSILIPIS